jgi:hypothetical protein
MRRVEELQQQILTLSREEFAELRAWFWEHDSIAWDEQIEADSRSGKLDKLVIETSQRRYRELVEGKVAGVPGPLVFDRLHAELPLSPEERAELDRALDAHEADRNPGRIADAEWLKEAKDRLAAYHSGDLPATDAEQVFNELGKRT